MDIKKIKPTLDRILVERLKEENVTKSGLLIDAASAGVKIGETGNLEETKFPRYLLIRELDVLAFTK